MKTVYVMSFHGDAVVDMPAFTSKTLANEYQRTRAKGCFVDSMVLIENNEDLINLEQEARKNNGTN